MAGIYRVDIQIWELVLRLILYLNDNVMCIFKSNIEIPNDFLCKSRKMFNKIKEVK